MCLETVTDLQYLVRRDLAIRGVEACYGNVLNVVELRINDDDVLKRWSKQKASFTSVTAHKEVIAHTILRNIFDGIQEVQSIEQEATDGSQHIWDDWCQPEQHAARHIIQTQTLHHSSQSAKVWRSQQYVMEIEGCKNRLIDPSLGGPIELFLVQASVPRLV